MDTRRSAAIINKTVAGYIDSLYVNKNPQIEELRAYAWEEHVPIIIKDCESFLVMLLNIKKPKTILEIGTAIGYSASVFANACNCKVKTIEADPDMYKAAITNIRNFGFEDRIDVILGDGAEELKKLSDDEKFDMVFIDAAKSHYKLFWELVLPHMNDGAMIICDNILMKGMTASDEFDTRKRYRTSIKKMRSFLDYITNLEYADTCVLPIGDGVSVSVINRDKIKSDNE